MADGSAVETKVFPIRPKISRRQFFKSSSRKGAGVVLGTVMAASVVNKLTGGSSRAGDDRQREPLLKIEPKTEPKPESPPSPELSGQEEIQKLASVLFEKAFHNLSEREKEEARRLVEEMKRGLVRKTNYEGMVAATKRYEDDIRRETDKRGILPETGFGIVLIEDGGVDKVSDDDARGFAQLLPETARDYGMIVAYDWQRGGVDERVDPVKSIGVLARYLRDRKKELAQDEGLAIWSYHAGIGNVLEAVRVYLVDIWGIDIGSYGQAIKLGHDRRARQIMEQAGALIGEKQVSVHKVLFDRAVKEIVIAGLDEESELYVYKAVAAAELFDQSAKIEKFTS